MIVFISCFNKQDITPEGKTTEIPQIQEPKTSDVILIDKVYNFTTWRPWKMLEDISFTAEYNHYVYFQIVTPYVCAITVTIFDPEGSVYDVYYRGEFSQESGMLSFPFGAAITGPHDILFELELEYNLNIYIKIEQAAKCLYDVLSQREIQNLKQYGVAKFENYPPLLKNVIIESDVAYTLYFTRVTPITVKLPNNVRYNYSLKDTDQDILFEINWQDDPLAPIGSVTEYSFGTAHGGPYVTNLTIDYVFNPVNIAFAIVYDHKISGEIDGNATDPGGTEGSNLNFSIPVELATGTIIGIGALTFIALGVVISKRRELNSP
ncbi:MAG: hypothetical protein ACFFAT_01165 [Promethearchaeota archaeon]